MISMYCIFIFYQLYLNLQPVIEDIVTTLLLCVADKLLNMREGLTCQSISSPSQPSTTLLTSQVRLGYAVECLIQHNCQDITDSLDMQHCDQYPFTRGGFGGIYRGALKDGQMVAIKCIEAPNDYWPDHGKNLKRAAREVYTWSNCKHLGILPMLGFAIFRGRIALVTPWMRGGSLKQHIVQGLLQSPLLIAIQLAGAVEYLHENGIVHGDIKPDNILLTHQGQAQLADFGSARLLRTTTLDFTWTTSFNFTIRFAAPEVLREESCAFTEESDIYALGVTIFNIMTGQLPFADKSAASFINTVINMKAQPSRPDFGNRLHGDITKDEMWNLLKLCLAYAPENRPKAREVKEKLIKILRFNNSFAGELGNDDS